MEVITVACIVVHKFICRFGVPEHLDMDQGRKKTRTSPYHPQTGQSSDSIELS